jgi:TatD DNase family protein
VNLTDTHCHLDLEQFDSDRAEVLARARAGGVSRILIPGLSLPSSRAAVELAASDPMLFAAVGVHPNEALGWDSGAKQELRALALSDADRTDATDAHGYPDPRHSALSAYRKIIAIGEIGLDYYWDSAPHDLQQDILRQQLDLAGELSLPAVIHLRENGDIQQGACAEDLLRILGAWAASLRGGGSPLAKRPGVLHSFGGSRETAKKGLELGFYIGVTGPVTYRNADARRELLRSLPLERLLIETDAPYLAPVPQRGKRNEPAFVRHIADRIAEIQHTTPDRVAEVTSENAQRLFGWE